MLTSLGVKFCILRERNTLRICLNCYSKCSGDYILSSSSLNRTVLYLRSKSISELPEKKLISKKSVEEREISRRTSMTKLNKIGDKGQPRRTSLEVDNSRDTSP